MAKRQVLAGGVNWYGLHELLTIEEKLKIFELAGYTPHANQMLIHESRARMRVVVCGRRFGKSTLAAFEAIAAAAVGGRVWAVAPDYDLASIVFDEAANACLNTGLKDLLANEPRTAKGQQLIQFKSGGWIVGKSSIKPRSLVGRGLDLIVFDEAAKETNPEVWYANLRPALTDRYGALLAITTPMGDDWLKGLFERGYTGRAGYESFQMPSYANPLLDPSEIDQARTEVPDALFRQEYLAEFLDSEGAVFTGYREIATSELIDVPENKRYVIGVDLARYEDWTVITVMETGGRVVHVIRTNNTSWALQRELIHQTARKWNYADVILDGTGVGDPIVEELQYMSDGAYSVQGFVFTSTSKTQLINQTIVQIQQKELELPADSTELGRIYLTEIGSYRYVRSDAGNLKMSAPPGKHDDCPMSLCLAVEARMRYSGGPPRPAQRDLDADEPANTGQISGKFATGKQAPRAPVSKGRPFVKSRYGRR